MNNYTEIDQETLNLEKIVQRLNDLESKMEDVNERYKKLKEIEEESQPICDKFSGSGYETFKNSGVISIEDIREFRNARQKLKEIEEEKNKLAQEAEQINKERSILESQKSEAYTKIVDLFKEKDPEKREQKYVPGLDGYFDIIDKLPCDYKDVVDDITSKIIKADVSIIEAIAKSYKQNITEKVRKSPNKFTEIDTLIKSLNESKRLKEEKIDSQMSLIDNGISENNEVISEELEESEDSLSQIQEKIELNSKSLSESSQLLDESENVSEMSKPLEEKVELVSEPLNEQSQLIDLPKEESSNVINVIPFPEPQPSIKQEVINEQSKDNVINIDNIMNNNLQEKSLTDTSTVEYRTINVFDKIDQNINKVANSNSEKYINIQNNIMKSYNREQKLESDFILSTNIKVVNAALDNTMQDTVSNVQNNVPTLEPNDDPISNFLNANKSA